jgi:sodium transport system permease protein
MSSAARPAGRRPWWSGAWTVFRKEWVDALRDRRTLATVLLSSVALGPLLLVLLSMLVSSLETRAEQRELLVAGAAHGPTLVNFVARQGYTVKDAPPDHAARLADQSLQDAVLVIPSTFEADLAAGVVPVVEVVSRSANARSQAAASRAEQLLQRFNQEQAQLRLAWRGVTPSLLQAVEVQPRDLADPAARAMQFTGMLPFFVLMAMLYGALTAALDATAGERERGSLEPLLMNPASPGALVLGKWAAVFAVALLIALLSVFSFLPGQWLLRSETLAALFRFGPREAALFLAVLAPLGAAVAAVLMAVAIRCRSYKEAQANASIVLLVASLLPLASWLNQGAEADWHLAVPVLAQVALMNRVLRGEPLGALDALLASGAMVAVAAVALALVAAQLRRAALAAR